MAKNNKTTLLQTGGKEGVTVVLGRIYIDGKPYNKKKSNKHHSRNNTANRIACDSSSTATQNIQSSKITSFTISQKTKASEPANTTYINIKNIKQRKVIFCDGDISKLNTKKEKLAEGILLAGNEKYSIYFNTEYIYIIKEHLEDISIREFCHKYKIMNYLDLTMLDVDPASASTTRKRTKKKKKAANKVNSTLTDRKIPGARQKVKLIH